MKAVLALALFACVASMAMASYGLKRGYGGLSAGYNNADRQAANNAAAEEAGAGTGTASEEGVPGTGLKFGYKYEPYYNRGYGYGAGYGRPYGAYGGYGYGAYAGPYGAVGYPYY